MAVRARPTGPANAAHCGQAFVVRPKPAIAGTAAKIVMGAPVRCSGFCDAKCDSENSESEQQRSHGGLPNRLSADNTGCQRFGSGPVAELLAYFIPTSH